jgi:tRNA1(Val) A37 N6-methylase TrmN6
MLILGRRFPHSTWVGVEIQEDLAALAKKNVQANGLESRMKILCTDARTIKKILPSNSFDAVIFNPPYRKLKSHVHHIQGNRVFLVRQHINTDLLLIFGLSLERQKSH